MAEKTRILVGRIGAAHGIKGGVKISAFTQDPLSIALYGELQTDRPGLTITIADARLMKSTVIAKLKGVTDRTAAEALNGVSLYVDRDALPATSDEDEFYHADLLGLEARLSNGTVIGEVSALPSFGAGDLIEVRDPRTGDTYLYPFTRAVVPEVRIGDGFVVIEPPTEAEPGEEDPQ